VKTIVERTVVTLPREKTEFVCDHCDFRDHSANIVREHEANEHLVKAKLEVDYLTLYHFLVRDHPWRIQQEASS
jgi:hypothetical protein